MSNYDNTNRFSVWGNKNKETESHPDFTGSINIEGVEYFMDGWKRRPDQSDKAPAMSGKIKRKDKQPQQAPKAAPVPADDFDSDSIPF